MSDHRLMFLDFSLWAILQLGVSKIAFLKLNFDAGHWLYREREFERQGAIYRRFFKIRSWKRRLPDGAKLFKGAFRKTGGFHRHPSYVQKFLLETYRGEWAHWLMIAWTPVFFLWNPRWADALMVIYALATNVPCIMVQRYNRLVFKRILLLH